MSKNKVDGHGLDLQNRQQTHREDHPTLAMAPQQLCCRAISTLMQLTWLTKNRAHPCPYHQLLCKIILTMSAKPCSFGVWETITEPWRAADRFDFDGRDRIQRNRNVEIDRTGATTFYESFDGVSTSLATGYATVDGQSIVRLRQLMIDLEIYHTRAAAMDLQPLPLLTGQ